MKTTKTTKRTHKTNTGFKGISYTMATSGQRFYVSTNRAGHRRRFYINSRRTREQAFANAMVYTRGHSTTYHG